ncbi:MAG: methyl-accepting chemotaxis protein, partial [Thermotogaceae bacterium]|nr:methyl-accepting chemotaxis protein [Thermotogaceae bacterium]
MKSVFSKILLGFMVVIGLMVLMGIITFFNLSGIEDIVSKTSQVNLRALETALGKGKVLEAILLKDEELLSKTLSSLRQTKKDLENMIKVFSFSENQQRDLKESISNIDEMISNTEKIDLENVSQEDFMRVIRSAEKVDKSLNKIITDLGKVQEENLGRARINLIVWCCIAAGAGVVLAFFIGRILTSPIKKVAVLVKNLSDGVLNVKMDEVKSKDEIGVLANSIERLRGILLDVVIGINEVSTNVASSSEELSATSQELSANLNNIAETFSKLDKEATDNSAALEEINASIEEFASTADNNSKAAQKMLEQSEELSKVLQENSKIMKEAMSRVSDVKEQSQQVRENLERLQQFSSNI